MWSSKEEIVKADNVYEADHVRITSIVQTILKRKPRMQMKNEL